MAFLCTSWKPYNLPVDFRRIHAFSRELQWMRNKSIGYYSSISVHVPILKHHLIPSCYDHTSGLVPEQVCSEAMWFPWDSPQNHHLRRHKLNTSQTARPTALRRNVDLQRTKKNLCIRSYMCAAAQTLINWMSMCVKAHIYSTSNQWHLSSSKPMYSLQSNTTLRNEQQTM